MPSPFPGMDPQGRLDYRGAPPPPAFAPDDAAWVAAQIEYWRANGHQR